MRRKYCRTIGAALASLLMLAGGAPGRASAAELISGTAAAFELSVPVRDLKPTKGGEAVRIPLRINPLASAPDRGARGTWTRGRAALDPLATASQNLAGSTPGLDILFDGTANPFACDGCSPPDTNGDVGKRHYIQIVNATKVGIFKKTTGTLATPVFNLSSLWTTGPCTVDAGDPIALFDDIADRWLLAQFADPHHLCFAISQTVNPLGAFHLFTFDVGEFPDYFKVGVWPSGYYVSANETTYTAYAFDRAKMLAGDPTASFVKFTGETNFLLPADVDGSSHPGGGGYFYTFKDDVFHGGVDRIELFRLTPDFAVPANSKFKLINTFPIASFTYTVCGFFNFDCIPQKGTAQRVDAVSEWPMQRFAYRKIGSQQELVGNFTVGGGAGSAGAAIRWFELRDAGHGWALFQEGTQDLGDGLDRFMGSIAMDEAGDIALGYSASSSTQFPSIRYATRNPSDHPGTLAMERVLKAGDGSQIGSDRWGDYSGMTVDPVSDCQFWYTNEYYKKVSAANWKTAVGAFTVRPAAFAAVPCGTANRDIQSWGSNGR